MLKISSVFARRDEKKGGRGKIPDYSDLRSTMVFLLVGLQVR